MNNAIRKRSTIVLMLATAVLVISTGFRMMVIEPEPVCKSCGSISECLNGTPYFNGYPQCVLTTVAGVTQCHVEGEQGACSSI